VGPTSASHSRSEDDALALKTEQRLAGLDKATWGEGPWVYEPDTFYAEYHGFGCWALRHPTQGSLCGYVEIPVGHPWHGLNYNDIRGTDDRWIEVHGGLTYTGDMPHVTDSFVVGFDCNHGLDYAPKMEARLRQASLDLGRSHKEERYRDLSYVLGELRNLARQAKAAWSRS
jgi:hypothetical protein